MTHIVFENTGEIDPLLISTFGVNVKENDSAIGFFGTGLKYALAILVRSGCDVAIQSGPSVYTFGKRDVVLRGKTFEFVTMNGEQMGFTTEVGKKWSLWMAYRELFCNAQDEAGKRYEVETMPEPSPDVTRVIVSGPEFVAVARSHGRYFLSSEPFLKMEYCDVHYSEGHGIYYRKVLIGSLSPKPTLHTYNVTGSLELTEDRTMKETWATGYRIAMSITACHDRDLIRLSVTAPEQYQESDFDFDNTGTPSAEFMEVVGELMRDRISKLNRSAIEMHKKHAKHDYVPDVVELNAIEQAALEKARDFCRRIGFDIRYPVIVVESLGTDVYGMAMKGQIYLAQRAFMIGTKCVAGTLIEEYVHLKHGHADNTRSMQNYLLDRMVSLGEQVVGEPL